MNGKPTYSRKHNGSVDLLKFLLAAAIVIMHTGETWAKEGEAILPSGGIGVEAFFVISGYLMCVSAEKVGGGRMNSPGCPLRRKQSGLFCER